MTRSDRVRPDATNLRTCGRHGGAAQPWRGEKLILIRVVLAGLCSLLLLRRQMDQHLHGGRLSQPRSGDIVKPGGVSPRFCIPQNDSQAPKGRHRPPALSSLEIAGLLADVAPAGGSGKYAVTLVPGLTPPGFMISPHFRGSEDPRSHQRKREKSFDSARPNSHSASPDGDLAVARYVPLLRWERICWFAPA